MPTAVTDKASVVNAWLWKQSAYPKMTHDHVEGWLAVGNAFAHNLPEKDQYGPRQVSHAIQAVGNFLGGLLA
jgi:hypothetical protein